MIAASPPGRVRTMFIGYGAPVIAIIIYLFYWLLYLCEPLEVYVKMVNGLGVPLAPYPLIDLESVLKAIDCARQGIDVTLPNACMGGGLFQYSPLVLKVAALPLGTGQLMPLGLSLDGLFLISLFTLPRPRRWCEFWQLLLAALSSSTLWAIEAANIDVAIYLLVLGGIHLLLRGQATRLVGYATLLGAAAIKFYPACLMILAARERPGRFLAITLVSLAAALLLAVSFPGELGHVVTHLPQVTVVDNMFSASNLPLGLALLVNAADVRHGIGLAVWTASSIFLTGLGAALVRQFVPAIMPGFRALPSRERILLITGSVSIAFCFFAAKNLLYREIFLILTLPGLWALQRGAEYTASGQRFQVASWVVVGLLWSQFFRVLLVRFGIEWLGEPGSFPILVGTWALRELLWWWLASLLVSFTLCFLWDAPVLARWRRRVAA